MFTNHKHPRTVVSIIVLFSICCGTVNSFASVMGQDSTQLLRQTITTLHKARVNSVLSQQKSSQQGVLIETERKDFLLFLSYLDGRILFYCQELYKNDGPEALNGLPCPTGFDTSPVTPLYTPVPASASQTGEEKVRSLEGNFNASLGEFDDMLLKEQERIALNVPRQREDNGSGGDPSLGADNADGTTGNSKSDEKAVQSGGKGEAEQKSPSATATGSTRRTAAGGTRQSQAPPTAGSKDLSKSDDDIVARQLKEAAERETDPEVKAKLWEEYRKYKEGIR